MDEMNVQAGQRPKAELVKRSQTAIFENRCLDVKTCFSSTFSHDLELVKMIICVLVD